MANKFFTADTHFGHSNIIKYCNRPFKDSQEMDEALIANWNSKVKPEDEVYHLGDFAFGTPEFAWKIRRRLNGKIYLIRGNHEKPALSAQALFNNVFEWTKDVHTVRIGNQEIFLSHYAHRVWNKSHRGTYHLFGHSHGTLKDLADSLSFDVGVDCQNYFPLSFDEVIDKMKLKTFTAIDHHGAE